MKLRAEGLSTSTWASIRVVVGGKRGEGLEGAEEATYLFGT